jgi:hypothetical protein
MIEIVLNHSPIRETKTAHVVLTFHKGDQVSARNLLELLLAVDEGVPCRYHLQYGSNIDTLRIGPTILKFMNAKQTEFSTNLPDVPIPREMIDNDLNLHSYEGNHATRTKAQKWSIFQWNLCVYKYIQMLDSFLMMEPDCVVLKEGWLHDILIGNEDNRMPIFGHIKQGMITGKPMFTHWAGCSLYNGKELRKMPLLKMFTERLENPWWKYRNEPGTTIANNCLYGPVISGYDVSYDYFLFALHFMEKTGDNDPTHWPLEELTNRDDLIFCDFRSSMTTNQIITKFLEKLPLMHGVKKNGARDYATWHFHNKKTDAAKREPNAAGVMPTVIHRYPLGGPANSPVAENKRLLAITDLRDRFNGKRCFIIGNGPSLNRTDITLLKNEYTIGLNRIYLNFHKMGYQPTFFCVTNSNIFEQFGHDLDRVDSIKFFRHSCMKFLTNHWNTFYMDVYGAHDFNTDISNFQWCEGWTVTYCAMQVAFYLGFSEVIIVGVDHNFINIGEPNSLAISGGDDPNHFHSSYFGKGINWDFPDLERSKKSYKVAMHTFASNGRSIFDATIGGKLDVFPKVNYLDLFN